ncbi:GGDEF domain-containing protein [Glaciecola sp. 1036]|uniref:GGDEF domain-containing protein n=1 Tax=Alteromonadaceae TaxID=72275 RepID=UPI003D06ED33
MSFILVIGYDFIPLRSTQLFPAPDATLNKFSDGEIGGASSANWIDQQANIIECNIVETDNAEYCGGTVTWWDQVDLLKDFSDFQYLLIDIDYKGESENIGISMVSKFDTSWRDSAEQIAKSQSVTLQIKDLNGPIKVYLKDFRIPDWWINMYSIPPSKAHPQKNDVISLGITMAHPYTFTPETFQLKSIVGEGVYFSKESMFVGLLLFWAFLFIIEGIWRYYTMLSRINEDEQKLNHLAKQSEKYKTKSETDLLTGLRNRDGLAQSLSVIDRNKTRGNYGILVIDVDFFKSINDKYGHDVGDRVLEELGVLIQQKTRAGDLVTRWGGEEFVVIFEKHENMNIKNFADNLRLFIASSEFAGNRRLKVTVTIGVAQMSNDEDFKTSFKRADQALYAGKRDGRNQIKVAD